jgi:hypothetical protein
MPTVYILKCEHNCYYIGKTRGSYFIEIENHFQGKGCEWTKIHKPIRLEILRHFCNENDDDFYTRLFITKYGLDKVRGGSYSQVQLTEQEVYELKQHPIDQQITCFKCSMKGHKGYICPFLRSNCNKYNANESTVIDTNDDDDMDIPFRLSPENHNTLISKIIKFFTFPVSLLVHKISFHRNNIISIKYDTRVQ